ncbi:MAG: hypothetical protein JWN56_298 [Sphingobacteriales bacterium]|nr:hypothetical protein [Sphingobacteriales bacterium]
MMANENLIAIGRSRYLYDTIIHLNALGYSFKAIVTEEAYSEYDIKHVDFEKLANRIGAKLFMCKCLHTDEIIEIIKAHSIHIAISVNWKYTIPESFLDLFDCGILNFHLGNLPDYKGNATVNWSIINGEKYINANVHKMAVELDSGDVISRESIRITDGLYVADILTKAEQIAPLLFEQAIKKLLINPDAFEVKGSTKGLRCYPRLPEDSQVDWNRTATEIYNLIRASSHPFPGAFTYLNGEKIIIWKAKPHQMEEEFLAIPGHVLAVNKASGCILVACKNEVLKVQEVEWRGIKMPAATLVKSIKVRFKFKSDV